MDADSESDRPADEDPPPTTPADPPPTTPARKSESPDLEPDLGNQVVIEADTDFDIFGCQLTRRRLDHLWDLARDGFSASSYVSIKYVRRGKVDSKHNAKSIDDLLVAISKSAVDDDLEKLDNLRLSITNGNRAVRIRFRDKVDFPEGVVSVSVSGDEEWVHGRSSILRDFLESTRSPLLMGRGVSRLVLMPLGFIAGVVIAIPSLSAYSQDKPLQFPLYLNFLLLVALIGLGYSVGTLIDHHNRGRIILSEVPRKKADLIGLSTLIVSALILIATVIAILVAHSDAVRGR